MFAFAGLWETWKEKGAGKELHTYTIITTDPNELMQTIHNRMPVIVQRKDYERWLAPTDSAHLPEDPLRPFPAEEMTAWRVGKDVGNARNNRPELVEPVAD
ncbi:MAG: SOS response-associated peptidase family protein [Terracidiphilus sp.]